MDIPQLPLAAQRALDRLVIQDSDLAGILDRAGPLPWRSRPTGFPGLLQAIVAQLISNAAASAIWNRLRAIPGVMDPATFLTLPDDPLRNAGLSRPKVAHARALATAFVDGTLQDDALARMDDADAIRTIVSVRGLGPWTAEVYLLFALGRPDIFPAGDVALAAAAADLKGFAERPNPVALRKLAEMWRPHRSLAARLLWHHWRHMTGRPAMDDLAAV